MIDKLQVKEKALEIGCYEGRTTLFLLNSFSHVDVVDTFKGSPEIRGFGESFCDGLLESFQENLSDNLDRVGIHKGPSTYHLSKFVWEERKYDFIYVDGDHSASQTALDGLLAINLLRPGGIVVFDDYLTFVGDKNFPTSSHEAIDFMLTNLRDRFDVLLVNSQVAMRKK